MDAMAQFRKIKRNYQAEIESILVRPIDVPEKIQLFAEMLSDAYDWGWSDCDSFVGPETDYEL